MNRTDDLVEVYVPQNSAQVMLLKQLLSEAGLHAFVVNDNMEGVTGEVPFMYARPRIWVPTSEAATARQICEEFDQRLADKARGAQSVETPFCYHCGETVTEQTKQCPVCGASI